MPVEAEAVLGRVLAQQVEKEVAELARAVVWGLQLVKMGKVAAVAALNIPIMGKMEVLVSSSSGISPPAEQQIMGGVPSEVQI
jgi:hypothetical protein